MSIQFDPHDESNDRRWITWPNAVTCLRIIGSPALVLLAMQGQPMWAGGLVVVLVFTEWLDGYLARSLHQESAIGARLDTVADAFFYCSLLLALILLSPKPIGREASWIAVAIGSYLLSWLASWLKFQRLPSYHTWAAKGVWVVFGIGIVSLLAGWTPWPFRIAMLCVVLTNLEAVAITCVLPKCQVDVPSLWHLMHRRQPTETP